MSKLYINTTRVLTIFIFVLTVLAAVTTSVFELDFYTKVQNEQNVAKKMNISDQELKEATALTLLYVKGYTSDLVYEADVNGVKTDIFSQQDKDHMIDVANLYADAYNTLVFCAVIIFALTVFLFIRKKHVTVFTLTDTINKTSGIVMVIVVFMGLFAYINFDVFWTLFHKVFFTNDLWFMDASVDALVNLFPAELFSALVFKILFRFIVMFGAVNIAALGYRMYSMKGGKND